MNLFKDSPSNYLYIFSTFHLSMYIFIRKRSIKKKHGVMDDCFFQNQAYICFLVLLVNNIIGKGTFCNYCICSIWGLMYMCIVCIRLCENCNTAPLYLDCIREYINIFLLRCSLHHITKNNHIVHILHVNIEHSKHNLIYLETQQLHESKLLMNNLVSSGAIEPI